MRRSFFCPEVVQASAMDCGPACLAAFLEGHGVDVSFSGLRHLCRTGVDGTTLGALEEVAIQFGFDAELACVPNDHLGLPEAGSFPCIAVFRRPQGFAHFVVAWRRVGKWVQVMDPSAGRQWMSLSEFAAHTYEHALPLSTADWIEHARESTFDGCLRARLTQLGVDAGPVVADAWTDTSGWSIAVLDAVVRWTKELCARAALREGAEASAYVKECFAKEREYSRPTLVPERHYSAVPSDVDDLYDLKGAVVLRAELHPGPVESHRTLTEHHAQEAPVPATPQAPGPVRRLLQLQLSDTARPTIAALVGLIALGLFPILEALLLRGFIDAGGMLQVRHERVVAGVILLGVLVVGLALQASTQDLVARLGRRLEIRFRVAFLQKLPRLDDTYFSTRLISDLAARSHVLHNVRSFADIAARLVQSGATLVATLVAVAWVDPASAVLGLLALLVTIFARLLALPVTVERDLRARTHLGALTSFYLDSLIGLLPIRSHGASGAVAREHESLLKEWEGSALSVQRINTWFGAAGNITSMGIIAGALITFAMADGRSGAVLLLAYWLLSIPVAAATIGASIRQFPQLRNTVQRLIEPLDADEEAIPAENVDSERDGAMDVRLENVVVRRANRDLLAGVSLHIEPGEHVAIVGASGAGKSTLVSLLMGWCHPTRGHLYVDSEVLTAQTVSNVRQRCVWVDPSTQLWNRSLLDNLSYGRDAPNAADLERAIEHAALGEVLRDLPLGLQSPLSEGGSRLSGGEAQRVRLGRAMARPHANLVLLDEAFRGLDRPLRRRLVGHARSLWEQATLLCVTHDVQDTLEFDRVVVLHDGEVVEDGQPRSLMSDPSSRYARMVHADEAALQHVRRSGDWQRVRLVAGKIGVQA